MIKIVSDSIEFLGIKLFEWINRRKSDSGMFIHLPMDNISDLYQDQAIFDRCDDFNEPELLKVRTSSDMEIGTYRMDSKYIPIEEYSSLYHQFSENKNIIFEHIKLIKSTEERRTCLIYLHGFSERNYNNQISFLFPKLLNNFSIDVFAVHQPFHMLRSPNKQPYSGAYLFDSHPVVTIEGLRQAVHDISQIISYAKEHYERIIVAGFSLGGHVVSYLGTADNRADLYVMGQAGASLGESLKHLTVCPGLYHKKKIWIREGRDFDLMYQTIELLNYPSLLMPEQVVSIAGIYDRLITFNRVINLKNHFKPVYNINYRAGHIGILMEYKYVIKRFFEILREMEGNKDETN